MLRKITPSMRLLVLPLFALTLMMATVASAQNSCAISKWVQLPDESREGIDIRMDLGPQQIERRTLADDFLCDRTGPITCIKFWGSWDKDNSDPGNDAKGQLEVIHLSIHSDVPAIIDPATGAELEPSHPGDLLWEIDLDSFTETLHLDLCPNPGVPPCEAEGFWDPFPTNNPPFTYGADTRIWLYTVDIPAAVAFVQQGTPNNPVVYWLDINVKILPDGIDHKFGWKTSIDHWNDNAVRDFNGVDWAELIYPPGHAFVDQQIDLAFEINTMQAPPPTEACCYEEIDATGTLVIVCDDLTVADCLAKNGAPQGFGTDCTTVQCPDPPPPFGACCLPNGTCVETTQTVCLAHNGTYIGDNTICTADTCPKCVPDSVTCPSGQQSIGSSFLAGLIDNFAGAPEPATPDTALSNYIANCTAGYALQFDELPGVGGVPANSWFGHTFTGLPAGIVSATLEIRARATLPSGGGGLAWNDSMGFVDTISGCSRTDLWANRFMNLPESGGTWNAGQAATFCLDLDALPIGNTTNTTSIINDLATGRLRVWAQDDTGIDYILLNITICPCEYPVKLTFPVEVSDNFATPDSAPASPSAEITGAFSNLKGFDNFTPNRAFVHTFSGLPANIVGGTLQIGLRAHADISYNDGLALEFLNPTFRWGRAISTLAPTGPWTSGTSKVVTLNLANLPPSGTGVTSVIGDMTDGDLDVYVQDDTAVDYLHLRVEVCCDKGIAGDYDNDGDVDYVDFSIQSANWLIGVGP